MQYQGESMGLTPITFEELQHLLDMELKPLSKPQSVDIIELTDHQKDFNGILNGAEKIPGQVYQCETELLESLASSDMAQNTLSELNIDQQSAADTQIGQLSPLNRTNPSANRNSASDIEAMIPTNEPRSPLLIKNATAFNESGSGRSTTSPTAPLRADELVAASPLAAQRPLLASELDFAHAEGAQADSSQAIVSHGGARSPTPDAPTTPTPTMALDSGPTEPIAQAASAAAASASAAAAGAATVYIPPAGLVPPLDFEDLRHMLEFELSSSSAASAAADIFGPVRPHPPRPHGPVLPDTPLLPSSPSWHHLFRTVCPHDPCPPRRNSTRVGHSRPVPAT
jgi:hypothetical protein